MAFLDTCVETGGVGKPRWEGTIGGGLKRKRLVGAVCRARKLPTSMLAWGQKCFYIFLTSNRKAREWGGCCRIFCDQENLFLGDYCLSEGDMCLAVIEQRTASTIRYGCIRAYKN